MGLLLLAMLGGADAMPTAADIARAVGGGQPQIAADAIRNVTCRSIEGGPTEVICRWEQKDGSGWHRTSAYLAINVDGWHLIDKPAAGALIN